MSTETEAPIINDAITADDAGFVSNSDVSISAETSSETPITPVIVGESSKAKELSNKLFEEGIFALPIVFPMVARDKARIRTMMNAGHTKEDLDFTLEKFEKLGKNLNII